MRLSAFSEEKLPIPVFPSRKYGLESIKKYVNNINSEYCKITEQANSVKSLTV